MLKARNEVRRVGSRSMVGYGWFETRGRGAAANFFDEDRTDWFVSRSPHCYCSGYSPGAIADALRVYCLSCAPEIRVHPLSLGPSLTSSSFFPRRTCDRVAWSASLAQALLTLAHSPDSLAPNGGRVALASSSGALSTSLLLILRLAPQTTSDTAANPVTHLYTCTRISPSEEGGTSAK